MDDNDKCKMACSSKGRPAPDGTSCSFSGGPPGSAPRGKSCQNCSHICRTSPLWGLGAGTISFRIAAGPERPGFAVREWNDSPAKETKAQQPFLPPSETSESRLLATQHRLWRREGRVGEGQPKNPHLSLFLPLFSSSPLLRPSSPPSCSPSLLTPPPNLPPYSPRSERETWQIAAKDGRSWPAWRLQAVARWRASRRTGEW